MSDYQGISTVDVVLIRIVKAEPQVWYADKVGQTVKALKEVTQQQGRKYVSFKQWPRPTGFKPSGHYNTADVREIKK